MSLGDRVGPSRKRDFDVIDISRARSLSGEV